MARPPAPADQSPARLPARAPRRPSRAEAAALGGRRNARVLAWLLERRSLLAWWALSRALVLLSVGFLSLLGRPRGYLSESSLDHPLAILGSWDGRWYRIVAEQGYLLVPGHQSDPAFFPLLPVVLHVLHGIGIPTILAGVLFSNLIFLVGLLAFDELGRAFLPARDARRATVFAALFPMGFVFSMVYPEALVFAAISLAGVFALRGRWILCALCAAAAALARPQGVLVALPLATLVASRWPLLGPRLRGRALGVVLAAPLALLSYPLYLLLSLDDAFAWNRAETAWGRSFRLDGIVRALEHVVSAPARDPWLLRDVVFLAVYLVLLAAASRAGVPRGWVAAGALMVLLPLGSGSFESDARFGVIALPVFWGLAALARRPPVERALTVVLAGLLVAGAFSIPLRYP